MMKPCPTLQKESTQERERRRNKGQGPKSWQVNSPTQVGHKEVREQPSLHKSLEAYQLKKWEA
jgi:hypothetical protein